MRHSAEMLRCLAECDVAGALRLWRHVAPELADLDHGQALISLHLARTQTRALEFRLRAYSHRWLTDNGFPSMLPDELRPRAERLYPRVVEGVGISVNMRSPILRPAAKIIERSMADAVEDAYASGRTEPEFVRARMMEAREKSMRQLFGKRP